MTDTGVEANGSWKHLAPSVEKPSLELLILVCFLVLHPFQWKWLLDFGRLDMRFLSWAI